MTIKRFLANSTPDRRNICNGDLCYPLSPVILPAMLAHWFYDVEWKPQIVSKKSKKELKKAEAVMEKALKMQAKARKMSSEAVLMQLSLMQEKRRTGSTGAVHIPAADSVQRQEALTAPDEISRADVRQSNPGNGTQGLTQHLRNHALLYSAIGAAIIIIGVFTGYAIGKHSRPAPESSAKPVVAAASRESRPEAAPAASQLPTSVVVLDKWEMPAELLEISSNAFIDADRVAVIQDAEAIIYTYNLRTRQVESRLEFGKAGDFEALSVVGKAFYALRSDGHLFEVQPSATGKPSVKEYDLPLGFVNETEPMFYDEPNNRLLIGVKEKDPQSSEYKGVYSFDLNTKTMDLKPVMTIPAEHEAGQEAESGGKKKNKGVAVKPSEIALDPKSGDLYVLNGPRAEFLIVDPQGAIRQTIQLDKSIFPQPEGMCFSPDGTLYISSEGGKKGVGILAKVELR